ncbi:exported hypothetical protein [Cupriavidus oxalaticus]|uniref:Uncharacterized protein n=1 Tax=Cupriavidus oxalaticus TaxID=96344 RepID=A0A375FNK7_9BURK|nr:exported hypothetical protein [Cupriavidus oxalaticus]
MNEGRCANSASCRMRGSSANWLAWSHRLRMVTLWPSAASALASVAVMRSAPAMAFSVPVRKQILRPEGEGCVVVGKAIWAIRGVLGALRDTKGRGRHPAAARHGAHVTLDGSIVQPAMLKLA